MILVLPNGIILPATLSGPVWPTLTIVFHSGRTYARFPLDLPISNIKLWSSFRSYLRKKVNYQMTCLVSIFKECFFSCLALPRCVLVFGGL